MFASIQKRSSPIKFDHLAEKSEKGSISNLSTKVYGDGAVVFGDRGDYGDKAEWKKRKKRRKRKEKNNGKIMEEEEEFEVKATNKQFYNLFIVNMSNPITLHCSHIIVLD